MVIASRSAAVVSFALIAYEYSGELALSLSKIFDNATLYYLGEEWRLLVNFEV